MMLLGWKMCRPSHFEFGQNKCRINRNSSPLSLLQSGNQKTFLRMKAPRPSYQGLNKSAYTRITGSRTRRCWSISACVRVACITYYVSGFLACSIRHRKACLTSSWCRSVMLSDHVSKFQTILASGVLQRQTCMAQTRYSHARSCTSQCAYITSSTTLDN